MRLHFEDGEREVLATRLGLDDDADDAAVAQAVATWMQEDPASGNNDNDNDNSGSNESGANIDAASGDDVVIVDVASYRRLQQRDQMAAAVEETSRRRDRDELIEEAIADGKFSPGRREHYRERYDSDQEGTTALIGRLTKNTVPLEERGANVPTDGEVDTTAYPANWVPEVAARAERPKGRVHGEQ